MTNRPLAPRHPAEGQRDCPVCEKMNTPPARWTQEEKMHWLEENQGLLQQAMAAGQGLWEEEDLMQTALETALICFQHFDPERDVMLTTYVYSAIRNRLKAMCRWEGARKRSVELLQMGAPAEGDPQEICLEMTGPLPWDPFRPWDPGVEEEILHREEGEYRNSLIRRSLDGEERYCFTLLLEGIPQAEIARRMGCSRGHVRTLVGTIRRKLVRTILEDGVIEMKGQRLQKASRILQEEESPRRVGLPDFW